MTTETIYTDDLEELEEAWLTEPDSFLVDEEIRQLIEEGGGFPF